MNVAGLSFEKPVGAALIQRRGEKKVRAVGTIKTFGSFQRDVFYLGGGWVECAGY